MRVTNFVGTNVAANGNSGFLEVVEGSNVGLTVHVSDDSGTTPTIDFEVEWSPDGIVAGSAETPDVLAQIGVVATTFTTAEQFTVKARWCRVTWVVTGTPDYTFVGSLISV